MPYSQWFGKFNIRIHDNEINERHHRPYAHIRMSDHQEIVVFLDETYESLGTFKDPTDTTKARKTVKRNIDELLQAWYDCNN